MSNKQLENYTTQKTNNNNNNNSNESPPKNVQPDMVNGKKVIVNPSGEVVTVFDKIENLPKPLSQTEALEKICLLLANINEKISILQATLSMVEKSLAAAAHISQVVKAETPQQLAAVRQESANTVCDKGVYWTSSHNRQGEPVERAYEKDNLVNGNPSQPYRELVDLYYSKKTEKGCYIDGVYYWFESPTDPKFPAKFACLGRKPCKQSQSKGRGGYY